MKKTRTNICPCGNAVKEYISRINQGRGKYCSKTCMYKYRKRPSNLKYKIKKKNKSWFESGEIYKNQLHKTNWNVYVKIHEWVRKAKNKNNVCVKCKKKKKTEWANVSRRYLKNENDWIELCHACHRYFDFHRKDISWVTA